MNKKEREEELCLKIAGLVRDELFTLIPFYHGVFGELEWKASADTGSWGTDGTAVLYSCAYLLGTYQRNPWRIKRGFLHITLHGLYLHFCQGEGKDPEIWNLSCDMAAEWMLDHFDIPWGDPVSEKRKALWAEFEQKYPFDARKNYDYLIQRSTGTLIQEWKTEFLADDHGIWPSKQDADRMLEICRKWEQLLEYTNGIGTGLTGQIGTRKGSGSEEIAVSVKRKQNYRHYLKKFMIPREEIQLDTESFDYVFYNYGLEHYRNMPFIEPLEYKEGNRLEELVIAIDTSGSCSKQEVQCFLEETFSIFQEKENFFQKMNVFLLQCDCYIQEEKKITCKEDWLDYIKHVGIKGRGGTDFRPVFERIKQLRKLKELKHLKALLYFTDGDGIYPREKPDYQAAFIFLKTENIQMDLVPNWADVLILEGDNCEY